MTPRYPPTVIVNGKTIPNTWDGTGLLAIDKLVFLWGRANLTDNPVPSALVATLIDINGDWASRADLFGSLVTVTTGLGTVFRGTIDGITLLPTTIRNPDTGRTQSVYQITLSAVDITAALHKTFPLGEGSGTAWANEVYGDNVHLARSRTYLHSWLSNRMAPYVSGIELSTNVPATNYFYRQIGMSENMSFADFIKNVFGNHVLSWLNYNPATNYVSQGLISPVVSRSLTFSSDQLNLTGASIHTVSGSQIERLGTGEIVLGLQENISAIVHTWYRAGRSRLVDAGGGQSGAVFDYPKNMETSTQFLAGVKGSNVLELNGNFMSNSGYTSPTQITVNMADRISKLNGQLCAPAMRFDFERFDYGTSLETIFLQTCTTTESIYISGIEQTKLAAFLPHFQIIGGNLTYQNGWTFEPHMAPTRNPKGSTLTVAQICTNEVPTISQFHPSLSLADLGNLDIGAS